MGLGQFVPFSQQLAEKYGLLYALALHGLKCSFYCLCCLLVINSQRILQLDHTVFIRKLAILLKYFWELIEHFEIEKRIDVKEEHAQKLSAVAGWWVV